VSLVLRHGRARSSLLVNDLGASGVRSSSLAGAGLVELELGRHQRRPRDRRGPGRRALPRRRSAAPRVDVAVHELGLVGADGRARPSPHRTASSAIGGSALTCSPAGGRRRARPRRRSATPRHNRHPAFITRPCCRVNRGRDRDRVERSVEKTARGRCGAAACRSASWAPLARPGGSDRPPRRTPGDRAPDRHLQQDFRRDAKAVGPPSRHRHQQNHEPERLRRGNPAPAMRRQPR